MDIYAVSEPRQFISFHLDNEQSDQPTLQAEKPIELARKTPMILNIAALRHKLQKKTIKLGLLPLRQTC